MNDREGLPQRATDEPRARVYAAIAVVVFAAEATFAAVHVFRGGRYPGFDYWPHDPIVVVVLLVAWSAGALGFLLRRWWCVYLVIAGTFASVMHALLISLSFTLAGAPFLLAAAIELTCLVKTGRTFVRKARRPAAAG